MEDISLCVALIDVQYMHVSCRGRFEALPAVRELLV